MLGEPVPGEHSSLHVKQTGRMLLLAEWKDRLHGYAAANELCEVGACAHHLELCLESFSLSPMVKLQLMQGQGTDAA